MKFSIKHFFTKYDQIGQIHVTFPLLLIDYKVLKASCLQVTEVNKLILNTVRCLENKI